MNGTFHITGCSGGEMWLDGKNIERIEKFRDGGCFSVKVVREPSGIELARGPELIVDVSAVEFYPNQEEKKHER